MGLLSGVTNLLTGAGDLASAQRSASGILQQNIREGMGIAGETTGRLEELFGPTAGLEGQFLPQVTEAASIGGLESRLAEIESSGLLERLLSGGRRESANRLGAAGLRRSGFAGREGGQDFLNTILGLEGTLQGRQASLFDVGRAGTGNLANVIGSGSAQQINLLGQLGQAQAAGILAPAQTQAQGLQSLLGLGGQLGAAALSRPPTNLPIASDERLKENITQIGTTSEGIKVYIFNYIRDDEPQIGVMAQEVIKAFPDAVTVDDAGYYQVDYAKVH